MRSTFPSSCLPQVSTSRCSTAGPRSFQHYLPRCQIPGARQSRDPGVANTALRVAKLLSSDEQQKLNARIAILKRDDDAGSLLDALPESTTAGDVGLLFNRSSGSGGTTVTRKLGSCCFPPRMTRISCSTWRTMNGAHILRAEDVGAIGWDGGEPSAILHWQHVSGALAFQ